MAKTNAIAVAKNIAVTEENLPMFGRYWLCIHNIEMHHPCVMCAEEEARQRSARATQKE